MWYNFKMMDENTINHLGEPYDTCSVMHYNAYAFSIVSIFASLAEKGLLII